MADFFEDCLRDLSSKVGKTIPAKEFSQVFCHRCRNAQCSLAGWAGDLFGKRVQTQADRLLNPVQANPKLPKYAQITGTDFEDMLDHAMQLEIADQRGDWVIPEIDVSDGRLETASRETTHAVDNAIRNLAQAQGQPEPNLPVPRNMAGAFAQQAESMLSQLESLESLEESSNEVPVLVGGDKRDRTPMPQDQPLENKEVFRPPDRANTDTHSEGLMIGGTPAPKKKPRKEPVDPWAPPKESVAKKVEAGARIRMGLNPTVEEDTTKED